MWVDRFQDGLRDLSRCDRLCGISSQRTSSDGHVERQTLLTLSLGLNLGSYTQKKKRLVRLAFPGVVEDKPWIPSLLEDHREGGAEVLNGGLGTCLRTGKAASANFFSAAAPYLARSWNNFRTLWLCD